DPRRLDVAGASTPQRPRATRRAPGGRFRAVGVRRGGAARRQGGRGWWAQGVALMTDRTQHPSRWEEVPTAAYRPTERLKAMDAAGVDYSALYPMVSGAGGHEFSRA